MVSSRKAFWVQWGNEPVRLRPRCTHDLRGYEARHLPASGVRTVLVRLMGVGHYLTKPTDLWRVMR